MTADHRVHLDVGDVLAIRVECVKCSAAVVIKPSDWRGSPMECPSCREMWEFPQVGDEMTPLQQFGLGLSRLLTQLSAPSKGMFSGGPRMPYSVKLEVPS